MLIDTARWSIDIKTARSLKIFIEYDFLLPAFILFIFIYQLDKKYLLFIKLKKTRILH